MSKALTGRDVAGAREGHGGLPMAHLVWLVLVAVALSVSAVVMSLSMPRARPVAAQSLSSSGSSMTFIVVVLAVVAVACLLLGRLAWPWPPSKSIILRRLDELQREMAAGESLAVIGAWLLELPSGVAHWNAGTYRIHGFANGSTPPTMRQWLQLVDPRDVGRWRETHRRALRTGHEACVEYRLRRAGGDTIWVRSVCRPEPGSRRGTWRLAGIMQDITTLRAIAEQVERRDTRIRDLIALHADWMFETDADGRVTRVTDGIVTALGAWATARFVGRPLWKPDATIDPGPQAETLKLAVLHRQAFSNLQLQVADDDGQRFVVSLSGRPMSDQGRDPHAAPAADACGSASRGFRGLCRNVTHEVGEALVLRIDHALARAELDLARQPRSRRDAIDTLLEAMRDGLGWDLMIAFRPAAAPGRMLVLTGSAGRADWRRRIESLIGPIDLRSDRVARRAWLGHREHLKAGARPMLDDPRPCSEHLRTVTGRSRAQVWWPVADDDGTVTGVVAGVGHGVHLGEQTERRLCTLISEALSPRLLPDAAQAGLGGPSAAAAHPRRPSPIRLPPGGLASSTPELHYQAIVLIDGLAPCGLDVTPDAPDVHPRHARPFDSPAALRRAVIQSALDIARLGTHGPLTLHWRVGLALVEAIELPGQIHDELAARRLHQPAMRWVVDAAALCDRARFAGYRLRDLQRHGIGVEVEHCDGSGMQLETLAHLPVAAIRIVPSQVRADLRRWIQERGIECIGVDVDSDADLEAVRAMGSSRITGDLVSDRMNVRATRAFLELEPGT